jgi:hypothetical protein
MLEFEKGDILYEDRFCRLHSDRILLKTYYFPLFLPRTIMLRHIVAVFVQPGGYPGGFFSTPFWGCCSISQPAWWACNFGREWQRGISSNVLLQVMGHASFKAFSVKNYEAFVSMLKWVLSSDEVPIFEGLPY